MPSSTSTGSDKRVLTTKRTPARRRRSRAAAHVIAVILVAVGCARITATYRALSPTYDETFHLAAGMEFLAHGGCCSYEPEHPPLARAAAALPVWISGLRPFGDSTDAWAEGRRLLLSRGRFEQDLALARHGILIFFVIACAVVYVWARRLYGDWIGTLCLFEFTLLPLVLGHSGLITTDAAMMAMFGLFMLAFLLWQEAPSLKRAIAAGACLGLAMAAKFSAPLFLASCLAGWLLLDWIAARKVRIPGGLTCKGVAAALIAAFLTLWASYGFRSERASAAKSVRAWRQRTRPDSTLDRLGLWATDLPLPAGNFARGLALLAEQQQRPTLLQYFRGEISTGGWPLYFPTGVLLKTPLAFLVLAAIGAGLAFLRYLPRGTLSRVYPPVFVIAILLVCVPSSINRGMRHILPIYPFLAITSGVAMEAAWNARRRPAIARGAAACLLLWLSVDSFAANSDYISSFNELAGERPEKVLIESDLDWGQDLYKLRDFMKAKRVQNLHSALYSSVKPEDCGITYVELEPDTPVAGWVAVSLHHLGFTPEKFAWLGPYPWRNVGKSIRVYRIPEPAPAPAGRLSRWEALSRLQMH
jgi:hypothetical protein